MYARLAATAWTLDHHDALRQAIGKAQPYPGSAGFLDDLRVLLTSLKQHGAAKLTNGACSG